MSLQDLGHKMGLGRFFKKAAVSVFPQIENGTHRQLSVAELDELIDCLGLLKDATQANLFAMHHLMHTTPKKHVPEVQALCRQLKDGQPIADEEIILSSLVLWASTLENTRRTVARVFKNNTGDESLPVNDEQKDFVLTVTLKASKIFTTAYKLLKEIETAESLVNIPQIDIIKTKLSRYDKDINDVITRLLQISLDTNGKGPLPLQFRTLLPSVS